MKKIYFLVIALLLFTGCGETKQDYDNESNRVEFIITKVSDYYDKTAIIDSEEEVEEGVFVYQMHFKEEPEIKFQGSTLWYVSVAIPNRSYSAYNNYDDVRDSIILEKIFTNNNNVKYYDEKRKISETYLEAYSHILEVENYSYLKELPKFLYNLNSNDDIPDPISLKIKYNKKTTSVLIKPCGTEYELSYYEERINNLY